MFCPQCGVENPTSAKFCMTCGASLHTWLPAGSLTKRFLALIIDIVALSAIFLVFLGLAYIFEESDVAWVALFLSGFVAQLVYIMGCNTLGQSLGMKVAKLRIVRINGERIDFGRGILRALALLVGLWFFWFDVITIVMVCARDDRRGLHDFASGTMVVSTERSWG